MRSMWNSQNSTPTITVARVTIASAKPKPRTFDVPSVSQGGPRTLLMKSGMGRC
jgi:hypothetical protein